MICLITEKAQLRTKLTESMERLGISYRVVDFRQPESIGELYDPRITGAVVDCSISHLPLEAWFDLLLSIGRRIPVVACGQEFARVDNEICGNPETFTWLRDPTEDEIIATLDSCGALGLKQRFLQRQSIPLYNAQATSHSLRQNGCMSVLTINATSFRKIAIDCGGEVYYRVQDLFHGILFDLWGAPGCFRATDFLCRHSVHDNLYFVFLEKSRTTGGLPPPGALERLADRLVVRLHNAMWDELSKAVNRRLMPVYLNISAGFSIGYATGIYNPCREPFEFLDSLIETAKENAQVQMTRLKARQREVLQCLMLSHGVLYPHYQAVLSLKNITRKQVEAAGATNVAPYRGEIFGFESLIRIRPENLGPAMGKDTLTYLDAKYMRPDILFTMAQVNQIALELDQSCLSQAVAHATHLPGVLMVNILPRNLYYIDKLLNFLPRDRDLIFEVSESEAVDNVSLMRDVRETLEKAQMGLAADDFGKGYTSLERVMQIRPDIIKMDRSLIVDIHEDKARQGMVRGLVEAARAIDSNLLAEGVEKWEEAELLQEMGVELVQGFLFHKPQSADLILEVLREEDAEKNMENVA